MGDRLPGAVCRVLNAFHIDAGTMCRAATPARGSAGAGTGKKTSKVAKATAELYGPPLPPAAEVYGPPVPDASTTAPAAKPAVSPAKFDIENAVEHLDENAHKTSQGKCAAYVREAIEAGGVKIGWPRPLYAKDYGPTLTEKGFKKIDSKDYVPQKGDIVVLQPPKGQTAGHIQMYDGSKWVSDFEQGDGIYPGSAYRKEKVDYEIYRP